MVGLGPRKNFGGWSSSMIVINAYDAALKYGIPVAKMDA